jgi:class 3 adenylate cyclase
VNIASRIESSVCRPGQIVASQAVLDRLHAPVNAAPLGPVTLRGRQSEVAVFEIS